jgi:hypothetical protein
VRRLTGPNGIALVSVLFVVLTASIVGTALFFAGFLDSLASSNFVAGQDALYVADAGVAHTWSLLDPAPDFAAALAWPDARPPFASPLGFPSPPRTYRVTIAAADGGLRVTSEGTSHRGARARVEATFARDAAFRPVALLVVAPGTAVSRGSGGLAVGAEDLDGLTPPLTPVAAEAADSGRALRPHLPAETPIEVVASSGLAEAARRLAGSADANLSAFPDDNCSADWTVVRVLGEAEVADERAFCGVLVLEAPLHVRGRLRVEGVLFAAAGVEAEGDIDVRGAAWIAGSLRLDSGILRSSYSSAALAHADALRPGTLPRAAVLKGWRRTS